MHRGMLQRIREFFFGRKPVDPYHVEPIVAGSPPEARTSKCGERLTDAEASLFDEGRCPDCGEPGLLAGPCGGLSQNFKCRNGQCDSRFNFMGPFGVERISDAMPGKAAANFDSYRG